MSFCRLEFLIKKCNVVQDRIGHDMKEQGRTGEDKTGQSREGDSMVGQVREGRGQGRAEQECVEPSSARVTVRIVT